MRKMIEKQEEREYFNKDYRFTMSEVEIEL